MQVLFNIMHAGIKTRKRGNDSSTSVKVARERPMHMLTYTIFLNHLISLFRFDSWRQEESQFSSFRLLKIDEHRHIG